MNKMDIVVHITFADLTTEQQQLLHAGMGEYGTSIMTFEISKLRAAADLVAVGLMIDDGLLRPDYRQRMFHTTILGRAFWRQANTSAQEAQS